MSAPRVLWISRRPLSPAINSGVPYFMVLALRQQGVAVEVLDGLVPVDWREAIRRGDPRLWATMGRGQMEARWARARNRRAWWGRTRGMCAYYGRQVEDYLRHHPADLVMGDKAAEELAMLAPDRTWLYSMDSCYADLADYDEQHLRLTPTAWRTMLAMERRAAHGAAFCVARSRWAQASALKNLALPAARVRMLYIGPGWTADQIPPAAVSINRAPGPVCRMLLVGREWERKGCEAAIALVQAIRARGVVAELNLIGPVPPSGFVCPPGVRMLPPLEKSNANQAGQLMRAFREASFYVQPSRRECLGIAYIEAASYGLPLIGVGVDGVGEIVVDGQNGILIPPGARVEDSADNICRLWSDAPRYRAYCMASRQRYEDTFNWQRWGRTMAEWIRVAAGSSINRQQSVRA